MKKFKMAMRFLFSKQYILVVFKNETQLRYYDLSASPYQISSIANQLDHEVEDFFEMEQAVNATYDILTHPS